MAQRLRDETGAPYAEPTIIASNAMRGSTPLRWRPSREVSMGKPTPHQVGRAGEHFVAGEILRHGGNAVTFAGNMPDVDVLASDAAQDRTVWIQVKTKRGGRVWQTRTTRGMPREREQAPTRFWVLVDLAVEDPEYYVVPEWWMQNDIHAAHQEYLEAAGGQRAKNPASTHHAIGPSRVEQWRDRWDLLGIF